MLGPGRIVALAVTISRFGDMDLHIVVLTFQRIPSLSNGIAVPIAVVSSGSGRKAISTGFKPRLTRFVNVSISLSPPVKPSKVFAGSANITGLLRWKKGPLHCSVWVQIWNRRLQVWLQKASFRSAGPFNLNMSSLPYHPTEGLHRLKSSFVL